MLGFFCLKSYKGFDMASMTGRPTKMTEMTVKKLEEAFALGCSDIEAYLYADITKQTLYNYQDRKPEFIDRKELLKANPILAARQSILRHIKENGNLALRYIEHDFKKELLKSDNSKYVNAASLLSDQELKERLNVQIISYADMHDMEMVPKVRDN